MEVRIGLSALSSELASWECARWEKMDFEDVKSRTADQWEKQLSAIDVKGGKKDDRVIFYTSLYRTYLSPADVSSPDGAYLVRMEKCISQKTSDITVTGRYGIPSALNFLCWY